jgi:nucleoside-diphosphate kinase
VKEAQLPVQQTLVLLKPDSVQRGLVGELVSRLERKGLKLVGIKLMQVGEDLARRHYAPHAGKPFFAGLIDFITSSPTVAIVVEGESAVDAVRSLMGVTDPVKAAPGTVRGDLALAIGLNLIHGSDSTGEAGREIALFFGDEELVSYTMDIDDWVTES